MSLMSRVLASALRCPQHSRLVPKFQGISRRFAHHDQGGIPYSNMPFSANNRYMVTLSFAVFFSTAFAAPFLMVAYQYNKDSM